MKSPGSWAVQDLFYGRPEALKLSNYIRQYIESLGPVKIEATKNQISFGIKKNLLGYSFHRYGLKRDQKTVSRSRLLLVGILHMNKLLKR